MEHIKQALDKSRGVRALGFDKPRHRAKMPGVKSVEYRETRVLPLNTTTLEANRIIAHTKSDPRSGHFDLLRTRLLQEMRANNWKTLAVTSPTPNCGKTVTSINLAFSIAQTTRETALLVDFDLRRPTVAKYMGLPDAPGLVDYLDGDIELREALVNPGVSNCVVLPNFKPVINAAETLASDRVADLVSEMRNRYSDRVVLFDLPPLLDIDDTLAILPEIDCVLLVVAAGQSTATEIKESRRLLDDFNLVGSVLNRSDAKSANYYY